MLFKKIKGEGPELLEVEMDDPVLLPGAAKTAVVSLTVTPANLSCTIEVYLAISPTGTKAATSGQIAFTSTGISQTVNCSVTMPTTGGISYNAYIKVYSGGVEILSYVGTETVVIPGGSIGSITWQ